LAGKKTFEGTDVTDTLAAVLRSEPDWTALPANLPQSVRRLITGCLVKDRRDRIRDMSTAIFLLDERADATPALVAAAPSRRRLIPVLVASAAGLIFGVVGALLTTNSFGGSGNTTAPETRRVSIVVPADRPIATNWTPGLAIAISGDGQTIAYVSQNPSAPPDRVTQLRVRSLSNLTVRDLPGAFLARQPFFSPDGQSVAFFTVNGELRKSSLAGGNPVTILTGIDGASWARGVWLDSDTIVFGTNGAGLRRIPAGGGVPQPLTNLAGSESAHWPVSFVRESNAVLFYSDYRAGAGRVDAVRLDTDERTQIVESEGPGWALPSGHLVFDQGETLLAAPFDPDRLSLAGSAVALGETVRRLGAAQQMAVSATGTLVYLPAPDPSETSLGRVSRDGTFTAISGASGTLLRPRVSPDGRLVAVSVIGVATPSVLMLDLARGTTTPVTRSGATFAPLWHPDGRSLAFRQRGTGPDGEGALVLRDPDGRDRRLVVAGPSVTIHPDSFTPDGKLLAFTRQEIERHTLWTVSTSGDPVVSPLVESSNPVYSAAFSPDGSRLAYVMNMAPNAELHVRGYVAGGDALVASGNGPRWSADGRTLYFSTPTNIMAVTVGIENGMPVVGLPTPVLNQRTLGPSGVAAEYMRSSNIGANYDVFPDGRFLVIRGPDSQGVREIVLVENWFEELKRLVPVR
jgi:serine/threonine-protein kinase